MSADLADLRRRRDALVSELADARRRRIEAEELAVEGEWRRRAREAEGPDATNAHVVAYVRDLARVLQDVQAELSRARRDARELLALAELSRARRRALEDVVARLARATGGTP